MKKSFLLILALITFYGCGETAPAKKEVTDINNVKTGKHVNIPGTRLYIIPPAGFKVADNFVGLQKDNYTAMQVYDLVGGSFYSNAATFNKGAFEAKGAKVFDYKELKVNSFPAKYIYMQGDPSAKAYGLVFGDSTFSVMIMATFPANDSISNNQIKEAILSIVYDKNLKVDPFANAIFKLDDNASVFKFAKSSANMYIYSIGGAVKDSYKAEPMVTVTSLPADQTMTPKNVSEMMMTSLQQYGMVVREIKNKSSEDINGYNAYESEIYGELKGENSLNYQLVLVNDNKAIIIQGLAKSDFEKNLVEFRKLAHTAKFK